MEITRLKKEEPLRGPMVYADREYADREFCGNSTICHIWRTHITGEHREKRDRIAMCQGCYKVFKILKRTKDYIRDPETHLLEGITDLFGKSFTTYYHGAC